jgi:hypothetical protein
MIKPPNQHCRPKSAQPTCKAQIVIMSGKPPDNLPSEVSILKTKAAAKKGLNVTPEKTEVVWPKPEFVRPISRSHPGQRAGGISLGLSELCDVRLRAELISRDQARKSSS